ncbi:Predicted membrane protein [Chryseobacterium taichungense]|uniref:Predicted membrane protein n=1 Tax=Chryseobacterium taichungense TaxID=295069 RepID=A0A1H7WXF7_9FLAO|nr:DUF2339 domain-containing protein [Chryseobacterium taichungense]SEM26014.1 Predicted membrane protein [Chryseobacterium taichungense]
MRISKPENMYILVIILIIIVIFLFTQLSTRIRNLENEISEIRKIQAEKQKEEEKEIAETVIFAEEKPDIAQEIPSEVSDVKEQPKDRIRPVFEFLQQNSLTITGIFTLVLGIGYFVKYAIDKNWIGEISRAGIGFAVGVTIIAMGHFLRRNYTVFASIITGGGIAILYFTTTIAFREYHLFAQSTAFSVTCIITVLSILLSYYYKSEILIIFSLFGGFLAPLMISTGQSNYPFLFTYISVINIGMLAVAFLRQWKSIGWISFIFTYLYLFYWTLEKTEIITIYFYIASYIIFYVFALQSYFRKQSLSSRDILMLVLINFTSIIGTVYIFKQLQYDPVIIFPVSFGFLNCILLYRECAENKSSLSHSVFSGMVVSLITVAVALQFRAHLITSVWAVEATLLLFIWKKNNLRIFKIFFYILFPLVIIAQMMTWAEYLDAKNLTPVFNPIFLTSSVTVFTTLVNLVLLRKLPESKLHDNSFFENLFTSVSFAIVYVALLLEILYQISEMPPIIIFSTAMLFSICYIFTILLFRKKLEIRQMLEIALLYIFLSLIIFNTVISGTGIVSHIVMKKLDIQYYFLYGLYLLPLLYTTLKILRDSAFFQIRLSYWLLTATIVIAVSMEFYHLYILLFAKAIPQVPKLQTHFSLLYLPIIWAVLASIFIYIGLKSNAREYGKAGFALLVVMILKLYLHDVWKMDNVSRIIAFIILGIILLLSSFLFQRLKNLLKTIVEKKDDEPENNHHEL